MNPRKHSIETLQWNPN